MPELDDIIAKINELKEKLEKLINDKHDLIDSEVVSASKKLDEALVEYEKAIIRKNAGGKNKKSNNFTGDSTITGDSNGKK